MKTIEQRKKSRQAAINKQLGDENLEKEQYEETFDKEATLKELKQQKEELSKLSKQADNKDEALLQQINEVQAKIWRLEKK
jgi:hypothetical protein